MTDQVIMPGKRPVIVLAQTEQPGAEIRLILAERPVELQLRQGETGFVTEDHHVVSVGKIGCPRHLEIQADARIRAETSGGKLLDVAFRRIESARGMYAAECAAFFQVVDNAPLGMDDPVAGKAAYR